MYNKIKDNGHNVLWLHEISILNIPMGGFCDHSNE